ncbi:hypothetical protein Tco_1379348 [Tanacetum coccineum]
MLPMIISIQIPHMLHLEGKLFESLGCLVLVRRDCIGSSKFTIYQMRKGCSVWSSKYIVNTNDFMNPLPEGWSIRSIVWSIVLGEREEDSFIIINLSAKFSIHLADVAVNKFKKFISLLDRNPTGHARFRRGPAPIKQNKITLFSPAPVPVLAPEKEKEKVYSPATEACKELLWLKRFLQELGFKQQRYAVLCDNQSTIHLAKNSMFHKRTKHIDIRYHWIRDAIEDGMFELNKVHTDDNASDMLTKAVAREKLKICCSFAGMANSSS